MSEKPALTHTITTDYNGVPVTPIAVEVYASTSGIAFNFPHPTQGFSRANVFVEYDAEDGLTLRVWDGPNNEGSDPSVRGILELDEGEQA